MPAVLGRRLFPPRAAATGERLRKTRSWRRLRACATNISAPAISTCASPSSVRRAPHRANRLFHTTTVVSAIFGIGVSQRQPEELTLYGTLLGLLLSKPVWSYVRCALCHTRLESAQGFITTARADAPAANVDRRPGADRYQFHDVRKMSAARCRFRRHAKIDRSRLPARPGRPRS